MNRFLALAALPLALACNKSDGDSAGDAGLDQDAADALWSEISGYESWNQDSNWVGIQESDDGTHGSHVQIWYNDTTAAGFAAGGDTLDDGSILVKEGYNGASEDDLAAITVMKKDGGQWFWARYTASGEATVAGFDESFCSGCHAQGKDMVTHVSW